jgi:histone-lysine N-methyltransferase SETMAR
VTDDYKKASMATLLTLLQKYVEEGEDFLGTVITGNEMWVFHYCPQSKAESMTQKHPSSSIIQKFKTMTSPGKVMANIFWDMHEVLLVDFIPCGLTINASCYQGTLTRLKEAVCHKRPGLLSQGVLLLHNNAQPHIARTTVNLLNTWHWKILPQPPYSPDLVPSDFHLLPKLKKHV